MTISPELFAYLRVICQNASDAILQVYHAANVESITKADCSPLTAADLAAHRIILDGLKVLTPTIPIISEEDANISSPLRASWERFWLVDPLDGTKEFLSRNGEFTVNIALIEGHAPRLGIVHVPITGLTYWGGSGLGAYRALHATDPGHSINVRQSLFTPPKVLGSRSHRERSLDNFLLNLGNYQFLSIGSALKFCVLAEGLADVYPRLSPTSEWDTAAGQAVLEGAGGAVLRLDGQPLQYNCTDHYLNPHFIAVSGAQGQFFKYL